MAVTNDKKLDLLLLVGGEELRKRYSKHCPNSLQITNRTSKSWMNTSRRIGITVWSCTGASTPNDHPTCTSPTSRRNAWSKHFIATSPSHWTRLSSCMTTVVKTSNVELRNEMIRKNGDLKSARETVNAFEIASKGSRMMKSGEDASRQDKGDPELKRVSRPRWYTVREMKGQIFPLTACRHRPGRPAPGAGTRRMLTRIHAQPQVGVWTSESLCPHVQKCSQLRER